MTRPNRLRERLRRIAVVVLGLAVVGATAGCAATSKSTKPVQWTLSDSSAAPSGDIDSYSFASYAEPYSLDYAYAFDYSDNSVLANVCESLLRMNADYSLSPGLAEEFAHPTPTTWVYTIRDGVTFHDGTTMTADDVVASMRRHIDPNVGSSWFSVYQNVESIDKTGAREVTVTMKIPDSQFNLGMGGSAGVIESAATLRELGTDYGNSTGLVNCTGPFALTEWSAGESVKLTRYDHYWDPALRAKAKTVDIVFMNDANARVNALKSGTVDGSWMIPNEAIDSLRASGKGEVLFGSSTAVSSIILSNLEGPLKDIRVRQALMYAMDRDGIMRASVRGVGTVTDVLTTESVWQDASEAAWKTGFDDITKYSYDLARAKKLIAEAGAEGAELRLVTAPIGNDFTVIAQAIAAAGASIGLNIKIETVTPGAYTALFSDPSSRDGVDMFYTSWYLSSPDAMEMYSVLRTGDFSNYGNWSDAKFDDLVNQAIAVEDPAARSELTAQAQLIANRELPWLPLFETPTTLYLGARITGATPSMNYLYFPWAATIGAR